MLGFEVLRTILAHQSMCPQDESDVAVVHAHLVPEECGALHMEGIHSAGRQLLTLQRW